MTHALAMRATSLAVSAAMLGALAILALSASWVVQQITRPDDGSIIATIAPEPKPPVQPNREVEPPRVPQTETILDLPPLPPLNFDTSADPIATTLPVETGPVTIENPHWLQRPRDLARYYPRRAITREVEGVALLDCIVSTAGRLACQVLSETPAGYGFGDAALRIAADHRMVPATRDGVAVPGRYRMRVPFELN